MGPTAVRAAGALAGALPGLWSDLLEGGYTPRSAMRLLRLAAHLGRWLDVVELRPDEVTEAIVRRYVHERRRHSRNNTRRSLEGILRRLRRLGVVPTPQLPESAPRELVPRTLVAFKHYLSTTRGLAPKTMAIYDERVRAFLRTRRTVSWDQLSAVDVRKLVVREARRCSLNYCRQTLTSMRSFFRFLQVQGLIQQDLASSVPRLAACRLSALPPTLTADEARRFLRVCERGTQRGTRDLAIILLLARLGRRAGEIARLSLDDVDWRAAELLIHGKAGRLSRLPLTCEIGEALAHYVQNARPATARRVLFLHLRAPHEPMTRASITSLATKTLRAAGIAAGGAHVLRQTPATQMLRAGATLLEISQVLRHRDVDSTTLYAKVDDRSLRELVRPWPRGRQT
jgi:integrase/recombinase XerD